MHSYGKMLKWWITQNLHVFVYDIKVGIYNKLNEYMVYTYTRGQVHSLFQTFVHGHSIFINFNSFCPEATGQTEVNLHLELS